MQVLINANNEVVACVQEGTFAGSIEREVPKIVLDDDVLSYKYINGEFVKNPNYNRPAIKKTLLDKISELATSVNGDINDVEMAIAELAYGSV